MVALLGNPEFCRATAAWWASSYSWAYRWMTRDTRNMSPEDRQQARAEENDLAPAFVRQWRVYPPFEGAVGEPAPYKKVINAVHAGRWGLVPVFPSTTEAEVQKHLRRIRKVIGKVHQPTPEARRGRIALWLILHPGENGQPRPLEEIAAAVWHRTQKPDLRRRYRDPEKAFEQEQALYRKYQAQGLPPAEISRRVAQELPQARKRPKASESPAAAMVRQALRRAEADQKRSIKDRYGREHLDALAFALTQIFLGIMDHEVQHGYLHRGERSPLKVMMDQFLDLLPGYLTER